MWTVGLLMAKGNFQQDNALSHKGCKGIDWFQEHESFPSLGGLHSPQTYRASLRLGRTGTRFQHLVESMLQ